jgi:hypothetical protein
MKNNYGYTISYSSKGLKNRVRGGSVFRTKKEAETYVKNLNKSMKGYGISKVRSVKATQKEYNKHVRRQTNDIINSRKRKK